MKTMLKNKTAVVIGASGGIGSAIAARLAKEGVNLVLSARDPNRLLDTAHRLQLKEFKAVPADISKPGEAEKLMNAALRKYGRLDLVVIASGGYAWYDLDGSARLAHETLDRLDAGNFRAPFFAARAAAVIMKKRRAGVIVNISSHAAVKVLQGSVIYGAAKAAARSVMLHLAAELEKHPRIRVYDIEPSTVNTPDMRKFIPRGKQHLAVQPEGIADKIVRLYTLRPKKVDHLMEGRLPNF